MKRETSMNQNIDPKQLQQMISNDITACESLLALLDEEQSALKERNADRLAEIINEKTPHLELLEKNANTRNQWAAHHQNSASIWAENISSQFGEDIRRSWERFKTLMQNCKVKNEVNGKMIARNQKIFGRLLDILRGQNTSNNLYNQTGNASGGNRSQIVGEA